MTQRLFTKTETPGTGWRVLVLGTDAPGIMDALTLRGVTLHAVRDPTAAERETYGIGTPDAVTALVISPAGQIALTQQAPKQIGLDTAELLRAIDGLLLSTAKLAAPANWVKGDAVVVGRVIPDQVARARFGALTIVTPYLRTVAAPRKSTSPSRESPP